MIINYILIGRNSGIAWGEYSLVTSRRNVVNALGNHHQKVHHRRFPVEVVYLILYRHLFGGRPYMMDGEARKDEKSKR